jgi:phospholipase C
VFVADPRGGIFATSGDPITANLSHPVKHVFVLMFENRSFDHMLGFSQITGTDAETGGPRAIDGLTGSESNVHEGVEFRAQTGATDVIRPDPGHNFLDTLEQLCGPGTKYPPGGPYPRVDNSGFASNYAKHAGASRAGEVMKCFAPEDLPVLNALAREFVVCDRWFSSMPGPTEPNRYLMMCGTCGTFDDSPEPEEIFTASLPLGGFNFRSNLFRTLTSAGVKWRIYADDSFPIAAELDGISKSIEFFDDIDDFEDLAEDLQDASFDAGFILIEPNYSVVTLGERYAGGNSQHPSGGAAAGERFLKAVYETIRNSPVWENSLLIITWDEHGGFYDHVAPPTAAKTGDRGRSHGFVFDQLGPRVPALVVSPLIPKNLIDNRVYDHTAVAATVRRIFKLHQFDERDGISGGVDHLVRLAAPRSDTPSKLPEAKASVVPFVAERPDAPLFEGPAGLQAATFHAALVQHLRIAPVEQHEAIKARVQGLRTRADGVEYMREVDALIRERRALKRGRAANV